MMKPTQTVICAALLAVTAAGLAAHPAFADGDKDKGKKKTVIVGPITTTTDPPKKK